MRFDCILENRGAFEAQQIIQPEMKWPVANRPEVAIAFVIHRHHAGAELFGDEDLPSHPGALEAEPGLFNAEGDGLRLVQAGHENCEFHSVQKFGPLAQGWRAKISAGLSLQFN